VGAGQLTTTDASFVSQLLNYGGLGLLALLCLVVLGNNAWSLNQLVKKADTKRINAARPLLLAQMGISLIGLLAIGGGAVWLELSKTSGAIVMLDPPWDARLDQSLLPRIRLPDGRPGSRPIRFNCTPGEPAMIEIDFEPYITHRCAEGIKARDALRPPTLSGG
jgi:hypothetical protein